MSTVLFLILLEWIVFVKSDSVWNEILGRWDASSWAVKGAVIVGILVLVVGLIGILLTKPHVPTEEEPAISWRQWPNPYTPISVVGRRFSNERVVLDGYSYSNCRFSNVTFVYNGTTAIQLSNNTIEGSCRLDSENPAVIGTIAWLRGLNLLRDQFNVNFGPANVVTPAGQNDAPVRPSS